MLFLPKTGLFIIGGSSSLLLNRHSAKTSFGKPLITETSPVGMGVRKATKRPKKFKLHL